MNAVGRAKPESCKVRDAKRHKRFVMGERWTIRRDMHSLRLQQVLMRTSRCMVPSQLDPMGLSHDEALEYSAKDQKTHPELAS